MFSTRTDAILISSCHKLGEVIRNLPLPIGGIKNTTGGNAPLNSAN